MNYLDHDGGLHHRFKPFFKEVSKSATLSDTCLLLYFTDLCTLYLNYKREELDRVFSNPILYIMQALEIIITNRVETYNEHDIRWDSESWN